VQQSSTMKRSPKLSARLLMRFQHFNLFEETGHDVRQRQVHENEVGLL
jgi:hypothetical protein